MTESGTLLRLLSEDELGLQSLQAFHRALDKEKHFDQDIYRNIACLSSEKAEDTSEKEAARIRIGEELADCLAYIVKLANYTEVDLHEAYVNKMQRNTDREWRKAVR